MIVLYEALKINCLKNKLSLSSKSKFVLDLNSDDLRYLQKASKLANFE